MSVTKMIKWMNEVTKEHKIINDYLRDSIFQLGKTREG